MAIRIDQFSIKSLYLESYAQERQLAVSTGFAVNKNGLNYLITNWHVATCTNPYNNQPLCGAAVIPNRLRVWFHGLRLGQWVPKDIAIRNQAGNRLWLEHQQGQEIDVVALPLERFDDVTIYNMDMALANFDLMLYPSSEVSIIGFPQGLTSAGMLPIWKTGHIASDIDIDWNRKPAFLIDATTKSGMSGSPVIAKRVSIYQTSHGTQWEML